MERIAAPERGPAVDRAETDRPPPSPSLPPLPRRSDLLRGRVLRWSRTGGRDVLAIVAISLVSLPPAPVGPVVGLDSSWQVALHLGARDHLAAGRDLVFTYGPLGFTAQSVYLFPRTWLIATATAVLATVALAAVTYLVLVRALHPWIAGLATAAALVVVRPLGVPALLELIAVVVAVGYVSRAGAVGPAAPPNATRVATLAAMATFASAASLVKADAGLLAVAALGTAVGARPLARTPGTGAARRAARDIAVFAGSVLASMVVLWMLSGQALGALGAWAARTAWIITGYGGAMGLEGAGRSGDHVVLAVVVGWLAIGTALSTSQAGRQRVAIGAVLAVITFLGFKHGFTRHGLNVIVFLALSMMAGVALVPAWGSRRAAAFVTGVLLVHVSIAPPDVAALLDLGRPLEVPGRWARLATDADHRTDWAEANRTRLRELAGFDAGLVAPARGRTVHISPWEASVAYAYPELRWRPLPVFQDYAAYTRALDQVNADALASDGQPEYILRQAGVAIDGRLPRWEPPAASLEMVCRYREVGGQGAWLLLERTASRCGPSTPIAAGEGRFSAPVHVPAAEGVVVARFSGIDAGPLERARTALYKSRELYADVGNGVGHRFVAGTQGSWHVVRAPACARRMLDGGAPDIGAITFSTAKDRAEGDDPFSYEVATIPFAC